MWFCSVVIDIAIRILIAMVILEQIFNFPKLQMNKFISEYTLRKVNTENIYNTNLNMKQ